MTGEFGEKLQNASKESLAVINEELKKYGVFARRPLTLRALRTISIKFLLEISMLNRTG